MPGGLLIAARCSSSNKISSGYLPAPVQAAANRAAPSVTARRLSVVGPLWPFYHLTTPPRHQWHAAIAQRPNCGSCLARKTSTRHPACSGSIVRSIGEPPDITRPSFRRSSRADDGAAELPLADSPGVDLEPSDDIAWVALRLPLGYAPNDSSRLNDGFMPGTPGKFSALAAWDPAWQTNHKNPWWPADPVEQCAPVLRPTANYPGIPLTTVGILRAPDPNRPSIRVPAQAIEGPHLQHRIACVFFH